MQAENSNMAPARTRQTVNLGSGRGNVFGTSPADVRCSALHEDGSDCRHRLLSAHHEFCPPHHREYKELNKSYKSRERYYNSLGPRDSEVGARAEVETCWPPARRRCS